MVEELWTLTLGIIKGALIIIVLGPLAYVVIGTVFSVLAEVVRGIFEELSEPAEELCEWFSAKRKKYLEKKASKK